jgi:integrase
MSVRTRYRVSFNTAFLLIRNDVEMEVWYLLVVAPIAVVFYPTQQAGHQPFDLHTLSSTIAEEGDEALMNLLLHTGIRVGEAASLKRGDIPHRVLPLWRR